MPTGAYTIDPNNASEPLDTRYVADMPAELRALKGKVNGLGTGGGGGGGGGTEYYANIADFGAVADFSPAAGGGGTGTDNAAAVLAAIATGKDLYIPLGNYFIGTWPHAILTAALLSPALVKSGGTLAAVSRFSVRLYLSVSPIRTRSAMLVVLCGHRKVALTAFANGLATTTGWSCNLMQAPCRCSSILAVRGRLSLRAAKLRTS